MQNNFVVSAGPDLSSTSFGHFDGAESKAGPDDQPYSPKGPK